MSVGRSITACAAAIFLVAMAVGASSAAAQVGATAAPSGPAAPAVDVYPSTARALNLPGRATLSCTATADGDLRDCALVSEDPEDWGFGEAALKMAPGIKVPAGVAGRTVQVPIGFRLDPAEQADNPLTKAPGFYIKTPEWIRRPTANDFAATYPMGSRQSGGGVIQLGCRVAADGKMLGCVVMVEEPKSKGFGQAALQLASRLQMRPQLPDGRPVENGVVQSVIRFGIGDGPEPLEPGDVHLLPGTWSPDQPPPDGSDVEGVGAVRCTVDEAGRLAKCEVKQDDPPGHGFAKAVLDTASQLRMGKFDSQEKPTFFRNFLLRVKFRKTSSGPGPRPATER